MHCCIALHLISSTGGKFNPRFFGPNRGPNGAWKERLNLLNEKEKDEMGQLVARKMKEMSTSILAWDPDEYTLASHQQLERQQEEAGEAQNIQKSKNERESQASEAET